VVESRLLYALVVPQEQDHLYLHRALLQSSYFHKLTDFVFCALQWQWTVLHGYDITALSGRHTARYIRPGISTKVVLSRTKEMVHIYTNEELCSMSTIPSATVSNSWCTFSLPEEERAQFCSTF